jgi:acetyl-CoA/propionyl-CoA carboxylase carboxyl transferase subunit
MTVAVSWVERSATTPTGRLAALFDEGSLRTVSSTVGSGVVTGVGTVDGVQVHAFATDPTVQGGALGAAGCTAIVSLYAAALRRRSPIVGVWQSGGARLGEGASSLDGIGQIFAVMTQASGRIPQISIVLGPAAGGAAYGPALTDLVVFGPDARVFVTGPDVVRSVTGEDVDMQRLGGPDPHSRRSGLAHVVTDSDTEAFEAARTAVSLLGRQGNFGPVADREFATLLPAEARRAYDVHPLIDRLLDTSPLELHPKWAPNMVTAIGRLAGRTVGVLATNPIRLGGCLDAQSAEKAARFVRCCDTFGVPLVVLVDVPGYLPGLGQEWDGVVRRGAKLLHAFAEARVPRVTLITHKAYGGAYIALNSRALGATRVYAWPTAEVDVMGPLAAVRILHRRRLAAIPTQEARTVEEQTLAAEHAQSTGGLNRAVELGLIDEVIAPDRTRSTLVAALAAATPTRGRHGNIPL